MTTAYLAPDRFDQLAVRTGRTVEHDDTGRLYLTVAGVTYWTEVDA